MNIDTTTLALIPVIDVKKPVLAGGHNGITHFHHNNSLQKKQTHAEYRPNDWGVSYGPMGRRHRASVIKGRIVDIFA